MKNKLKKAEIVENICEKLAKENGEFPEPEYVRNIVDCFFEEIKKGLINDRAIELRGFGTFEARVRRSKSKARNPKTGDIVSVNEHRVAVFRPGKELKEQVWQLKENE